MAPSPPRVRPCG